MPFLDSNLDLSKTHFTNEQLEFARSFLPALITEHDPGWLSNPVGHFALYWNDNAARAACYLIELSYALSDLRSRFSAESQMPYSQKVREFLNAKNEKQYEELITELRFGHFISHRLCPVSLEPMVPKLGTDSSRKPRSPDIGVKFDGTTAFFEVTLLQIGALMAWDKTVDQLANELDKALIKRGARRVVIAHLPLQFKTAELIRQDLTRLTNHILACEYGSSCLPSTHGEIAISWHTPPHFISSGQKPTQVPLVAPYLTCGPQDSVDELVVAPPANQEDSAPKIVATCRPGGDRTGAVFLEAHLRDSDHDEVVFKSLRNTLDRKRSQLPGEAPYILTIRLGSRLQKQQRIVEVILHRIFPNPTYSWVSAILLFTPCSVATPRNSTDLQVVYSPPSGVINLNLNARNPISKDFLARITT